MAGVEERTVAEGNVSQEAREEEMSVQAMWSGGPRGVKDLKRARMRFCGA